jgi:predicted aspartyl protease
MSSVSNVYGVPLEWRGAGLTLEMWLTGPDARLFCRLLLDTGATHLGLPLWLIDQLGLAAVYHAATMTTIGAGERREVSLYRLPEVEIDRVFRDDLLVAPTMLPEVAGFHGVLGMNWLRTFAHVGLMHLQTDRPILELHDPS